MIDAIAQAKESDIGLTDLNNNEKVD